MNLNNTTAGQGCLGWNDPIGDGTPPGGLDGLTVEEAKNLVHDPGNTRSILRSLFGTAKQNLQGKETYVCPCGHGNKDDGVTVQDRNGIGMVHCFGCGAGGDVIKYIQTVDKLDFMPALRKCVETLGSRLRSAGKPFSASEDWICSRMQVDDFKTSRGENLEDYLRACSDCLKDEETGRRGREYLQGRGISVETAAALGVGFDPAWSHPKSEKYFPTGRIITPADTGREGVHCGYVARASSGTVNKKFRVSDVGTGSFSFSSCLNSSEVVYIVEGAFDAMSIYETGRRAISLNSADNASKFLELVRAMVQAGRKLPHLILSLDSDKAGSDAASLLARGLEDLDVDFSESDVKCGCKDPSEAFQKNRTSFEVALKKSDRQANPRPDSLGEYFADGFRADSEKYGEAVPTGFGELDRQLSGGLHGGLYVLAAISSLGKTTFASQIADQIATSGREVIFFSLEQSKLEIASKMTTRAMASKDLSMTANSLEIRTGAFPEHKSEAVFGAMEDVRTRIGDRLQVVESNFNETADSICEYVSRFIRRNKIKPVVFVDYLQKIKPSDPTARQTEQEAIADTVTRLKRYSREQEIPIFLISSVNRANYLTPIDFEALKGSGDIEFSADVVLGLQLWILHHDNVFTTDTKSNIVKKRETVNLAKTEDPRKIELVCLKNRFGKACFSTAFRYRPHLETFYEWDGLK